MKWPLIKIGMITILLLIMSRELLSLPSPLITARILIGKEIDSLWVYVWSLFSYLLLPSILIIHIILLQLKYHMIEPGRAIRWFTALFGSYFDNMLWSVAIFLVVLYMLSITDLITYSIIRVSGLFPDNPMSHEFQITWVIMSLLTSLIFFFRWIFILSIEIMIRFSYMGNIVRFITKNWPLFIGMMSGLMYYMLNIRFLFISINNINVLDNLLLYYNVLSTLTVCIVAYMVFVEF